MSLLYSIIPISKILWFLFFLVAAIFAKNLPFCMNFLRKAKRNSLLGSHNKIPLRKKLPEYTHWLLGHNCLPNKLVIDHAVVKILQCCLDLFLLFLLSSRLIGEALGNGQRPFLCALLYMIGGTSSKYHKPILVDAKTTAKSRHLIWSSPSKHIDEAGININMLSDAAWVE